MCSGGRFLADFAAGTRKRPEVPDAVATSLALTSGGTWVVWARKVALLASAGYGPLTGGSPYPDDAIASCWRGGNHTAPEPSCTCGFHAVTRTPPFAPAPRFDPAQYGMVCLDVALSGRILAFEWPGGEGDEVLFRAERQTVLRAAPGIEHPPPEEPAGGLAGLRRDHPRGAGPVRLRLPRNQPRSVVVDDDAGWCLLDLRTGTASTATALVGV